MDTLSAYALGQANRGRESRVFDWDKAATLIRERNAQDARAGLSGDWEWTGGAILADGKPVPRENTYTYLASTWAIPELEIDRETIDCWRVESETPGWDSDTYWPESALAILARSEVREQS
jgi:hypothetical protein